MSHPKPRRVTLRDGRSLAYVEYGSPTGVPIIHCHGVPSSRAEGALVVDAAVMTALGIRMIVPDRPGVGLSDPQPNRRIVDWPDDVRALASHLNLQRFVVVGSSGGAPFALACGVALPEHVCAVGIIGGMAPADVPGVLSHFSPPLRAMLRLSRVAPLLLRGLFRLNLRALRNGGARAGARMAAMAPEPDRTLFQQAQIQRGFTECFAEACVRGTRGPTNDVALIARPWEFDVASIRVPVLLWHGERDRNVPVECGRYLAALIPQCRATFYPDDAHLSVPLRHQEEIYAALLAAGWPHAANQ